MMKRILIAGSILGLMAFGASGATVQFEHPDMKSGKKVVRTAVILPPAVSIVKSGLKGAETLVDESRQVEAALPALIAKALEGRGCAARFNVLTPEALESNADLRSELADLQSRFDAIREQLAKKPKDVRKGRFTLGDEVAKFNPGVASDALVFVRAEGRVSTGGKKAFSVLFGLSGMAAAANRIELSIAIVDSQTGTVLYFAKPAAGGDFVNEPNNMAEPIAKSFQNFAGDIEGAGSFDTEKKN